jgi:glycosyltransferase involved in cell wall biosynthesis
MPAPIRPGFVSIIVPVFNEQTAIPLFLRRLEPTLSVLPVGHEIVFVNDGSIDATQEILLAARQRNNAIAVVELSRNFGKEAAIVAGLSAAAGDAAIIIDVDLQDPPELIGDMVGKWLAGAEVVVSVRTDRSSDSFLKRSSAKFFYFLFRSMSDTALPEGSGDFRLLDRSVMAAFLTLGERARFNKGLFAWLGFQTEFVEHVRPVASRKGSRWKAGKLMRYAFDGLFSFSTVPIQVWSLIGAFIAALALGFGIFLLTRTIIFGADVPGYASLMVTMLFLGGIHLFTLGLLGEYVGRILMETKRRPLYIVRSQFEAVPNRNTTGDNAIEKRL